MSTLLWVAVGTSVAAFVAAISWPRPMQKAMSAAKKEGQIEALVQLLAQNPPKQQATAWDQAISELWRSYERHTAALLVVEGARRCDDMILQYWIRQILEVEPEIAMEAFSPEFLQEYFQPEVASQCGRKGCCG